jgi:hypothetical protein
MLKLHVVALWGAAGVVLARRFDLLDDGLQLKLLAGCVAIAAGCALAMRRPFCRRRPFRQAMRERSPWFRASLAASCVVPTLLGLRLGSRTAR